MSRYVLKNDKELQMEAMNGGCLNFYLFLQKKVQVTDYYFFLKTTIFAYGKNERSCNNGFYLQHSF